MKKILILLILILCGCNSNKLDLNKIMEENQYIIIDVRTKDEYLESHVIDSINIPYDEIDETIDKSKVILVYCKSGKRSEIAYNKLKTLGYEVYDLGSFDTIDLPKE